MNPWLTALDGLGTVSAVLFPVFLWELRNQRRQRSSAPVIDVRPAQVSRPEPAESAIPAMPFDSAVSIGPHGAPRIPVREESQ